MKKLIVSACICMLAFSSMFSQNTWKNLVIHPQFPKSGEAIRFEFDASETLVAKGEDDLEVLAVEHNGENAVAADIVSLANGAKISGSLMPGSQTKTVLLVFKRGERWETNFGEGYFIELNSDEKKPSADALAAHAALYLFNSNSYQLNRKPATAFNLLEKAFQIKPELKEQYYELYIRSLMSVKRESGRSEALKLLGDLEKKFKDEKPLVQIALLYDRLGQSEKANALRTQIRTSFPKGLLAKKERIDKIGYIADLAEREKLIQEIKQDYPPKDAVDFQTFNYLYYNLANKYAENDKLKQALEIAEKLEAPERAQLLNDLAWGLAEENKNLEIAKEISAKAVAWAETEIEMPTTPRPSTISRGDWKKERRRIYAGYADTHAFVLDKLGDSTNALTYQEKAVKHFEGLEPDINARYTALLEKTQAPDLRYQLEGFILKGLATPAMYEQFKRLFLAENNTEKNYESYIEKLNTKAKEHLRQELAASMLFQPAPEFTLKNLKGETVSSKSLLGKVLVIDFWATWCGPCKMAFPGMQTAVEKFKDDKTVEFLFLNCWERSSERQKTAADFIESKNYPFHVLVDEEDKVVAEYGVSGIPTKFIIDAKGNIRFKSVGYNGNNEKLVDELIAMIELAKQ